jgi:hypothetical protein
VRKEARVDGRKKSLQIESPLNRLLPSGGLDGAKYMKNSRDFFFFLTNFLFLLKGALRNNGSAGNASLKRDTHYGRDGRSRQ